MQINRKKSRNAFWVKTFKENLLNLVLQIVNYIMWNRTIWNAKKAGSVKMCRKFCGILRAWIELFKKLLNMVKGKWGMESVVGERILNMKKRFQVFIVSFLSIVCYLNHWNYRYWSSTKLIEKCIQIWIQYQSQWHSNIIIGYKCNAVSAMASNFSSAHSTARQKSHWNSLSVCN